MTHLIPILLMNPGPNQVCYDVALCISLYLVLDEPGPGEPQPAQVPAPGHQTRQLEPGRGERGGPRRREAAQEG